MTVKKPIRSATAGVILIIVSVLALNIIKEGFRTGITAEWLIANMICIALSVPATILARHLLARDADPILKDSHSKIVLFLRPFHADASLPKWLTPGDLNYEQELGYCLTNVGKLVAVGKPGERFATAGAARTYLHHDEWKDRVAELIRRAELVIICPGLNEGVEWEISTTLSLKSLRHILFFFPGGSDYLNTLASSPIPVIQDLLRQPIGKARLAWFDDDGCVKTLGYEGPSRWARYQKYCNKWTDAPIYLEALQPVLTRFGARPGFAMRFMYYTPYIYVAILLSFV
ncbi:MAG: hypothetical protein NTY98_05005, partial [Verrucomicrobia bacterium]|nr:hypothetical protein [Verrucomicrobiota bacterium]